VSESVVYLTNNKETILQKAKIMQLCRARLAIFCADRLVEEGEAIKILGNPVHSYTKEWLNFGSSRQLKNGALWQYCHPNCPEQHNNCQVKQNVSYTSWDCDETGLHKVICKGFFYFQ
jgi:ABC-type dipeptide/oligopeptide/nickel transport system ATPase component